MSSVHQMKRGIELSADITCWGSDKLYCPDHVRGITITSYSSANSATLRYYSWLLLLITRSVLQTLGVQWQLHVPNVLTLKICPFSLQDVFNIVRITTNRVNSDYFVINTHEEEEREKEIRSRDVVRGTILTIRGGTRKIHCSLGSLAVPARPSG